MGSSVSSLANKMLALTLTRSHSSPATPSFPIYFHKPVEGDADDLLEMESRYQQLEDYCNLRTGEKGNKLRLISNDTENLYEEGLTQKKVASKFKYAIVRQKTLSQGGCVNPELSFCKDNAHLRMRPCYCRHLVRGQHGAPVYVLPIPNCGLGVFSTVGIKKGEYVMDFKGEFRKSRDTDEEDEDGEYAMEIFVAKETINIELDSTKVAGLGRFLNHSCSENVGATTVLQDGKVRIVIMATRDIKPFQQLCINYGPDYFITREIHCFCGSDRCQCKPGRTDTEAREARADYLKFLKEHEAKGPRVPLA